MLHHQGKNRERPIAACGLAADPFEPIDDIGAHQRVDQDMAKGRPHQRHEVGAMTGQRAWLPSTGAIIEEDRNEGGEGRGCRRACSGEIVENNPCRVPRFIQSHPVKITERALDGASIQPTLDDPARLPASTEAKAEPWDALVPDHPFDAFGQQIIDGKITANQFLQINIGLSMSLDSLLPARTKSAHILGSAQDITGSRESSLDGEESRAKTRPFQKLRPGLETFGSSHPEALASRQMTALERLTPWPKPQAFRRKQRSRWDSVPETGGHPSASAGAPFPGCIAAAPCSADEAAPSSPPHRPPSHKMHCVPLIRVSPIRSAQHGKAQELQGQKSCIDLLRHHSRAGEVSMSGER